MGIQASGLPYKALDSYTTPAIPQKGSTQLPELQSSHQGSPSSAANTRTPLDSVCHCSSRLTKALQDIPGPDPPQLQMTYQRTSSLKHSRTSQPVSASAPAVLLGHCLQGVCWNHQVYAWLQLLPSCQEAPCIECTRTTLPVPTSAPAVPPMCPMGRIP